MGRVRTRIDVDGRMPWTLFDNGARNTCIVGDAATGLPTLDLGQPQPAAVGGKIHSISRECHFAASVEGHPVTLKARIVQELGQDEEHRRIEVLFGALAMQEWGINVDTKNERLDFTHYPKEFVEF